MVLKQPESLENHSAPSSGQKMRVQLMDCAVSQPFLGVVSELELLHINTRKLPDVCKNLINGGKNNP